MQNDMLQECSTSMLVYLLSCSLLEVDDYPDHFFPFFLHYFFTLQIWTVVTLDQEIINVGSGILGIQKKKIFWVYV